MRFLKKILDNLLLIIIGSVIGLTVGEVGLRILNISFPPVFDVYDHYRAIKLKPGKEGRYQKEGNAYVKINSLGYRDIEHTREKPADVFRIAILGDSFTEARQVDIENTYWKRLENILNTCPRLAAQKVEVLSFGVGGYGTTQELLTLRLHTLDFSPDLVIIAFPTGDVTDNSKQISKGRHNNFRPYYIFHDGELVIDNSFRNFSLAYLRTRFLLFGVQYSRVLEAINQARRVYLVRQMQRAAKNQDAKWAAQTEIGLFNHIYLPPKEEVWEEAWDITEELLATVANEVAQAGARFVLVTLTNSIQVHPDSSKRKSFERHLGVEDLFYPERRLRALGERIGFPVITLAERLQAIASKQALYLHGFDNTVIGQGHWNEEGHRLVAEVLAEQLCTVISRHTLKK